MSPRTLVLVLTAAVLTLTAAPSALAVAPPAPALPDLVTASDTGTSTVDNITSDSTPTFTVDAGTAQNGMTVTVTAKNATTGATVATATGVVSGGIATVTIAAAIPDGPYNVTATTTNGMAETSAPSPVLTLTVDSAPPTLVQAPRLLDTAGASSDVTFSAKPRFSVATAEGDTVELYESTTLFGTAVSVAGIAEVKITIALTDGSHTVYAKATDPAGNVSPSSPVTTFTVDTTAPPLATPDLVDDDGESATDNYTSNPRPRFTVASAAGARVTLFENGIGLGSAIADSSGAVTISLNEIVWLDPGQHCVYAIAWDALANASSESPELCITIAPGVPPFATNLGVTLAAEYVALSLRTAVSVRATVRLLHKGKVVSRANRKVRAGKRARLELRLPARARSTGRLVVVATLKSADGRTAVVRRVVRR